MPRTTLQAWRAWQDSIDACPHMVEFFDSVPGLAFLHRLVMALHVVFVEIGACSIRLVYLFVQMTGLNRFVGASFGTQQRINTSDEASGLLAYVEHHLRVHHSPDLFHVQHELIKAVAAPLAAQQRAAEKAATTAAETLTRMQEHTQSDSMHPGRRGPGRPPKVAPRLAQATQEVKAARQACQRLMGQREQVTQSR